MNGYTFASFIVCPFQYVTDRGELSFVSKINLNLKFEHKASNKKANPLRKNSLIKKIVVNPEELSLYYPTPQEFSYTATTTKNENVDYLIITTQALASSFEPLKKWKIQKGINTQIITLDYIYANYQAEGRNEDVLRVKKCLLDYYTNKNLKWVLLGGDNMVLPTQWCYVQNGSDIDKTPCDLFYACFDNNFDWDANKNLIFGELEDSIDMCPGVYISRLPIETAQQASGFVNKLLCCNPNTKSNFMFY